MKKVYIDTENVTSYEFLNRMNLGVKDEVILFLSKRSKHMNPFNLNTLLNCKASKETVFIEVEQKNAMDFQIVAYLALKHSVEFDHYIVSNDKGYSSAVNCFKNQFGYANVHLLPETFSEEDVEITPEMKGDAVSIIRNLEDMYGIGKVKVLDLIKKAGDCRKLHNNLVREYGQDGKEMYQSFKELYKLVL